MLLLFEVWSSSSFLCFIPYSDKCLVVRIKTGTKLQNISFQNKLLFQIVSWCLFSITRILCPQLQYAKKDDHFTHMFYLIKIYCNEIIYIYIYIYIGRFKIHDISDIFLNFSNCWIVFKHIALQISYIKQVKV